jgi:hypothetical protein
MNGDQNYALLFTCFFVAPGIMFSFLFLLVNSTKLFRFFPFPFYCLMIGLQYLGYIPIHLFDDTTKLEHEGISFLYRPQEKDQFSFTLLRTINLKENTLYLSHGQTCGIIAYDLETNEKQEVLVHGILRDMKFTHLNEFLWGLNWSRSEMYLINQDDLKIHCSYDFFKEGIKNPYKFSIYNNKLYLTSTFPALLSEYEIIDADHCKFKNSPWFKKLVIPSTEMVLKARNDENQTPSLWLLGHWAIPLNMDC